MKKPNKKLKLLIILIICAAVVTALTVGGIYLAKLYGVGVFNEHKKTAFATDRELLSFREPFVADHIWIEDNGVAVWAAFSKDVDVQDESPTAVLDIACDTYYWLWVNGEEVVWEGSLKRGVTPNDGFYDHVVINDKFKKGKNNISVLVRHLGDDGFSHVDSTQGGLVVEGTIGDKKIYTDGTWKAKKYAYNYSFINFIDNLNFRLSERGSIIDGDDYTEFWLEGENADWDNAVVLNDESVSRFGAYYLDPLPQKVIEDTVLFDLSQYDTAVYKRTTMTFDLDVNRQFCPYFEFEADKAGRKVTYYTENKKLNYKNTYSSKKGENAFLDFAWINGEKLIVTVDKGVTLKKVGYRATHYGAERTQAFTCEDESLNILVNKAVNTLEVTMRDSYMDCPDRERAQWIGDAVIENQMSFYSLSPESVALFRKAIITTYGWVHRDGVIQTVVPCGVRSYELPLQNLAFLVGCVDYVEYSGDTSVVPMIISMAENYLPLWTMKGGLVVHRQGSWDWGDWGDKIDMPALENAWYYYALSRLQTLIDPDSAFADFCKERKASIASAYSKYYTAVGISSKTKADDRADAIAVIAGLYRDEDKESIIDTLYNVRNSSPYMEKYVEQALCVLGRVDLAVKRAKEVYAEMIADDCTTLWELWKKQNGTTNHAWSGGTLVMLSRYVAGIYPIENGFASYAVEPDTSVLKDFTITISPVVGVEISVRSESLENGRIKITVGCTSSGGKLIVTGKNCVFNGSDVDSINIEKREFELEIGTNVLIFEK